MEGSCDAARTYNNSEVLTCRGLMPPKEVQLDFASTSSVVDVLYALNQVTADIEALDTENRNKDRTIVLDDYENEVSKDSTAKQTDNDNNVIKCSKKLDIDSVKRITDNQPKKNNKDSSANKFKSVGVLDQNRTNSLDVLLLDGNKTDSEGTITLDDEVNELIKNPIDGINLKCAKIVVNKNRPDGNKTDSEGTITLDDEVNELIKNPIDGINLKCAKIVVNKNRPDGNITDSEGTITLDDEVNELIKNPIDGINLKCAKIVVNKNRPDGNKTDSEGTITLDDEVNELIKNPIDGINLKCAKIVVNKNRPDGNITDSEGTITLDDEVNELIENPTDGINLKCAKIAVNENIPDSDNVIVIDGDKMYSESTIILDNEEHKKITENPDYLIIIEDNDCSINEALNSTVKKKNTEYDKLFADNPLMADFIEKCLNMKNNYGMSRIIHRTVLAIYKDIDEDYKKSDAFRKCLTRTRIKLDKEPEKKFFHMKNFCIELRAGVAKKRVPFITLDKKGVDKQSTSDLPTKRRKVDVIIDVDDIQTNDNFHKPKEYPPIEIDDDDDDSDVVLQEDNGVVVLDVNENANKENSKKAKGKQIVTTIIRRKRGRPRKGTFPIPPCTTKSKRMKDKMTHSKYQKRPHLGSLFEPRASYSSSLESRSDPISLLGPRSDPFSLLGPISSEPYPLLEMEPISDPNSLLDPRSSVPCPVSEPNSGSISQSILGGDNTFAVELNRNRICCIENEIAKLKDQVDKYEEMEVMDDSDTSPYVICEQLKKSIVGLYKELCQLTGSETTKRHEVKLIVDPGHPEGPVRCLEQFVNENIDRDGKPMFPDIHDVINCVCKANLKDNLNWSRTQIMKEAHALFAQLGSQLKKWRQKREWNDLMSFVKQEMPDPAEEDPALEARLKENTRLARIKEEEVLDRFVKMEQFSHVPDPGLELLIDQEDSEDDETLESDDTITAVDPPLPVDVKSDDAGQNSPVLRTGCSTVTIYNGNIVIQPQTNYNATNQNRRSGVSDLTLYSSEFQRFITERNKDTPKNPVDNNVPKKNTPDKTNLSSELQANFVKKVYHSPQNLRLDQNTFANTQRLDGEISSFDQAEQYPITDNANVQLNHESMDPTSKVSNFNIGKVHEDFDVLTHTKIINNNDGNDPLNTRSKEVTSSISESELNTVKPEETNPSVSQEFKDSETSQTENINHVKEGIIKPEPLDIPSMLEELGDSYTTTIFYIDDPFLVIEISDSSESEAEDF